MHHMMLEGFRGFGTRLDDLRLVHDVLEESPERLGLQAIMPPFLLPYYTGVAPDDCGISGFIFVIGGHITLHTLSRRQTYFMDVVAPETFDAAALQSMVSTAYPTEVANVVVVERAGAAPIAEPLEADVDFGPHLLLDVEDYRGPHGMEPLFGLLSALPAEVGMTPIMRPYVVQYESETHGRIVSGLTMIAESHVSLHAFKDSARAYADVFSCRFFERESVVARLKLRLAGGRYTEGMVRRGRSYRRMRAEPAVRAARVRRWVDAVSTTAG